MARRERANHDGEPSGDERNISWRVICLDFKIFDILCYLHILLLIICAARGCAEQHSSGTSAFNALMTPPRPHCALSRTHTYMHAHMHAHRKLLLMSPSLMGQRWEKIRRNGAIDWWIWKKLEKRGKWWGEVAWGKPLLTNFNDQLYPELALNNFPLIIQLHISLVACFCTEPAEHLKAASSIDEAGTFIQTHTHSEQSH